MITTTPATLPRRTAVLRLAAGGLAAADATRAASLAMAQEASPMASAIPALLQAWSAAWTAEDIEGLLALYTADARFADIAAGIDAHGQEELRASFQASTDAIDDLAITVARGLRAGEWAAMEGTFGGIQTGPLGDIPPYDRSFTVPLAAIFKLQEDQIRRETDYFDLLGMLRQLGIVMEPVME